MWEPVEVQEWVEIWRGPQGPRRAVWCTTITRTAAPDVVPVTTGIAIDLGFIEAEPLVLDWCSRQGRADVWHRLDATEPVPPLTWGASQYVGRYPLEE